MKFIVISVLLTQCGLLQSSVKLSWLSPCVVTCNKHLMKQGKDHCKLMLFSRSQNKFLAIHTNLPKFNFSIFFFIEKATDSSRPSEDWTLIL